MPQLSHGKIHRVHAITNATIPVEYHKLTIDNGCLLFYKDKTDQGAPVYYLVASFPVSHFYFILD
jgi:hypothetical protein